MNHFPELELSWPLLESDLAIDSDWAVFSVEYDYGESAAIILKQTAKGNFKIKCALFDPSEVNITKALTKLGANSSDQICYQEFDLRTHYQPTAADKPLDGNVFCSELQKILTSCGKDEASIREMATLVFGLLAGYTSQYIYFQLAELREKITDSNFRAPIFTARYTQSAWDVLSEIIENICPTQYCTSQSDRFYADLPRVIPTPLHAQNLTDKIALSIRYINDTEGTMETLRSELPGQYSGAVVLIDGNGFLNAQLAEFQKHNIWCTQVFFRLPASKMPVDPLPLDARILTKCSLDWDGTLMQTAIAAFSKIHLYKKKKFREILSSAQEKVKRYSSRHPSNRLIGQKKDKYIQLLLTIEYFADFVASLPNSPLRNELAAKWSYLLLPDVAIAPGRPARSKNAPALRKRITRTFGKRAWNDSSPQRCSIATKPSVPTRSATMYFQISPNRLSGAIGATLKNTENEQDFVPSTFQNRRFMITLTKSSPSRVTAMIC